MKKNLYIAWASNKGGATTDVPNGGNKFTSIREAENSARRQFGPGWTIHIEKVWIDGDDSNPEYNEEVRKFTLRK
jgi:hypothetical protein